MTKPQRYGSTWSLSKMCQALMSLGILKIMLFSAIGFGFTLPEFGIMDALVAKYEQWLPAAGEDAIQNTAEAQKNDAESTAAQLDAAIAAQSLGANAVNTQVPAYQEPHPDAALASTMAAMRPNNTPKVDPQGSAAVRAALAHKADPSRQYADVIAHTEAVQPQSSLPSEQSLAATAENTPAQPVVRAQKPVQEDITWWDNIFTAKSLPIPRLGVDQVAYAATLDAPPAPLPKASPQTPSAQPQVLPAGVAGPQFGVSGTDNLLVPNPNPPAPRLDAYVPPEDPTRKEQEIARREQELLMLKKQMEQRLEELQSAERKVQDMLKEAKGVEEGKVNALTNMYVNMKPRQAGAALENLDENIAAKILVSMKSKQAGEILSYMNPTKTAKLTELLSRMRLGQ